MSDMKEFLSWLAVNYPSLSEDGRARLARYGSLVVEAGGRIGMVARQDLPRFYMRHVREALAPALVARIPAGARVLDVGSGAGLPGVPIALVRNDLHMSLLEPRHRRAAFLERTILVLKLQNATVYTASVDALAREHGDLQFDWIVSRAVAWTPPMLARIRHLTPESAILARFGAPSGTPGAVQCVPIDADSPRAIQFWPRPLWAELPGAA